MLKESAIPAVTGREAHPRNGPVLRRQILARRHLLVVAVGGVLLSGCGMFSHYPPAIDTAAEKQCYDALYAVSDGDIDGAERECDGR